MEQEFLQPANLPFLEVRTTRGSVMPYDAHFHRSFCVGVIVEGRTRFYLDGEPHIARKGDIVLIEPGRVHSCNPIDGLPRGYHMLFLDAAWFSARGPGTEWGSPDSRPASPVVTDPTLYSRAIELVDSVRSGTGTEDGLSAFLSALMRRAGVVRREGAAQGSAEWEAALFPGGDIARCTISALARKARMRRESFSRLVRKKIGLPPLSYLHCLRIEKGRLLLRQGKSITEAALETGYADQSHFHRMFTRIVSATPGCYQKKRSHSYKR